MTETEVFIPQKAILAGATGLVGSHLLQLLLADNQYNHVTVLSRRPLSVVHEKLQVVIVDDFNKLSDFKNYLVADIVFCCIGTTMKKAGSKTSFYDVDYNYTFKLAEIALSLGAKAFFLVSAMGADKGSLFYYNRVKGEIETAIKAMGFWSVHIFRPSLLLGHRSERRLGEDVAKMIHHVIGLFIPLKYRGIQAIKVAKAMIYHARQLTFGNYIHNSGDMQRFT